MPTSGVKIGEMIGVTGEMIGEMPGIPGRRAARQPGRRSKNARKPTIKVTGNVGKTSETPRTMHATLPGTSSEINHNSGTILQEHTKDIASRVSVSKFWGVGSAHSYAPSVD
jgi:hypothetical protein